MCLVLDSNLEDFRVSCKYLVLADAGNPRCETRSTTASPSQRVDTGPTLHSRTIATAMVVILNIFCCYTITFLTHQAAPETVKENR